MLSETRDMRAATCFFRRAIQVEAGIGDTARITETLGQPEWLIVAIRLAGPRT